MFTSIQAVLCSQLQCLNNETRRSVLYVLVAAAVTLVPLSVMTPLRWNVSAHRVRRQVTHLHGANSLIFKEMCRTVVFADAAMTGRPVGHREHSRSLDLDQLAVAMAARGRCGTSRQNHNGSSFVTMTYVTQQVSDP